MSRRRCADESNSGPIPSQPRTFARTAHAVLVAVVLSTLSVLAPIGAPFAPAPASAAPVSVSIDNTSRASVRSAYNDVLVPALAVPQGWTGTTNPCNPGAPSAAARDATITALNWYRELGQLPPITLNATFDAEAQEAALIMSANSALSHDPPTSWNCYTAIGDAAAGRSNLALGAAGASAVALYMRDPGASNGAAGHRRWVMHPPKTGFSSGSTSNANALIVFGNGSTTGTRPATPVWSPYPTAGYFPAQLEPSGRWSLTRNNADFSSATVTMTKGGTNLPVTINPVANGYGDNTIVWQVSPAFTMGGVDQVYSVTVNNVIVSGSPTSFSYDVTLFDANVAASSPPTVTSVAPAQGPITGGTSVTITGTGFTGTTSVVFGTTPAASFVVNSDTQITAVTAPRAAGLINVYVTNPAGTNPAVLYATWFNYKPPGPNITLVSPSKGPSTGGASVVLTGTGFTGATGVKFGTTPAASFIVNSDTQITAVTGPRSPGLVNAYVTTPSGTSPAVLYKTWYTYELSVPAVTQVSPSAGPSAGGTVVTITGTGFTAATAVTFGTTPAASFVVNSDSSITATTAARAPSLVNVYVTTPKGKSAAVVYKTWFSYQ